MNLKEYKVVVGVSGGPDSMFLLNQIVKENNYKDIIACHVNYNFRSDSSNDQSIVEEFCKQNNIKCKILSTKFVDGNFEEWARIERYDFFVDVINENNFDKILIAHNLNDHIETFVMQNLRNGLVDYYGINEISKYNNVEVARPILNLKKSFILDELKKEKINYAIDSTNSDEAYLRNRVRKELNENDFEKMIVQINEQNEIIKTFKNKYEAMYLSKSFDTLIFEKMTEAEINRFVYCWIKENDKTNSVLKKKKKFVKEVIKQLLSKKSLKITTDNIEIEKKSSIASICLAKI